MKYYLIITVLKKLYLDELINVYSTRDYPDCDRLKEGQVFIVHDLSKMPEGFCDWAWHNIEREMQSAMDGIQLPWVTKPNTFIACCTDGLRPVIFKLERKEIV